MGKSSQAVRGVQYVAAAGALLLMVSMAVPSAQRTDNALFGVPVATNAILQNPDAYYRKLITVSAGVGQLFSTTVFLLDQRRAAGATTMTGLGKPLLVVAPYLAAPLDQKGYLVVRGTLVKFDPTVLAELAPGYALDLAPEIAAKYHGHPVLVASSVIDDTYTELGLKPLPPPSATDVALTAAMKTISPAIAALRTGVQEAKAGVVTQQLAALTPAFGQTESIFDSLGQSGAAEWAREASTLATTTERAAAAANWDAAKASVAALNQVCQNCHGVFRERQEDGTFRLKGGTF